MSKNSNFNKARSELLAMVGLDGTGDTASAPQSPAVEKATPVEATPDVSKKAAAPAAAPVVAPVLSRETPSTPSAVSTIAHDTTIIGDLTAGNLEIFGTVQGAVTAKGSVFIRGSVSGNIYANSICIDGGTISAELIKATDKIDISEGAVLTSNIECGNISLYAKVKGNLTVSGTCVLQSSAVVEGNLKAKAISVATGAIIKGQVEIG